MFNGKSLTEMVEFPLPYMGFAQVRSPLVTSHDDLRGGKEVYALVKISLATQPTPPTASPFRNYHPIYLYD